MTDWKSLLMAKSQVPEYQQAGWETVQGIATKAGKSYKHTIKQLNRMSVAGIVEKQLISNGLTRLTVYREIKH